MIWSVFESVSKSNCRFNAQHTFVDTVHSVRIREGFSRAIKIKGRSLSCMAQFKRSVADLKAKDNRLDYALIITIAKVEKFEITKHIGKVKRYVS